MPDDTQMPAQTKRQELANMRFDAALDHYTPQLADALPDHIPLARFKRVVITAVNTNPELARADRLSLFNSCVKCALDGLVPDGREAALVVYETSVKSINDRGMEQWRKVDMVQYMPMVRGIRKRMRNSGEVLGDITEVVHRNDKFHYQQGDTPSIEHEQPPLDQDRGEMVGAYSIIKLKNGDKLYEVMRASEIEHIMRTYAKGYDKPKSPWQRIPGEMWRKTVLRRNSKGAPSDSDLDRMLSRDDEPLEIPDARDLPAIPPRPERVHFEEVRGALRDPSPPMSEEDKLWIWGAEAKLNEDRTVAEAMPEEDPQQTWVVTLPDGELWEYDNPEEAAEKLTEALNAAPHTDAFGALWDDNFEMMRTLPDVMTADLLRTYTGHKQQAKAQESPQASEAPAPPQGPPEPEKAPTAAAHSLQAAFATAQQQQVAESPQSRIEVPNDPRGKPDYRAWALVKFMPVARRSTSGPELDQLIRIYAEEIGAYKLTLTPMYRKAFDDDIAALFAKLAET